MPQKRCLHVKREVKEPAFRQFHDFSDVLFQFGRVNTGKAVFFMEDREIITSSSQGTHPDSGRAENQGEVERHAFTGRQDR
jgi:hypothetical protein